MTCPCGKENFEYQNCCEPIISGKSQAETAEDLMRSRYSAYVKGQVGYLKDSLHPTEQESFDEDQARSWAKSAQWKGLEIVRTEEGGAKDEEGTVEFIAHYTMKGKEQAHHELAEFERVKGVWKFVDGGAPEYKGETIVRTEPKVGRNDPCPCGSGKKVKKCHPDKAA